MSSQQSAVSSQQQQEHRPVLIADCRSLIARSGSSSAFTLIELLVVLGVIGLIVSASVPALTRYANQARLKAATREVVGLLSLARSLAISSRATKTISINPTLNELVIEETLSQGEPHRVRLPSPLAIAVQLQGPSGTSGGLSQLIFKPSGALSGPSVALVLSNGSQSQTILVTAITGAVVVQ